MIGRSKDRTIEVLRGLNPGYWPKHIIDFARRLAVNVEAGSHSPDVLSTIQFLQLRYRDHELAGLLDDAIYHLTGGRS